MVWFKNTISVFLVLALFNTVIGKSFHEIFEHDHEVHECEYKGTIHIHGVEITHPDFICDFNFSVSLTGNLLANFDEIIHYHQNKVKIDLLWLSKRLCSNHISLRGPPIC